MPSTNQAKLVGTYRVYQAQCPECGEWAERTVTGKFQQPPKQIFCDEVCELEWVGYVSVRA